MGDTDLDTDEVAAIYDELLKTYRTEWEYRGPRSLHLSYCDEDHEEPGGAANNTMRVLSAAAGIDSEDRVLNIGCGAGEDSVWNAQAHGATVTGVNISETQLELARENAREHDVDDRTTFQYDDFQTLETIDDGAFDVVWGLEALSHSPDVAQALGAARRVLGDGGRVAFTDIFTREPRGDLTAEERSRIEDIDSAMGLRLGSIGAFEEALSEAGFENVRIEDLTEGVKTATERRYKFARVAHPVGRVLGKLGVVSETQIGGLKASAEIHKLVDSGVIGYYMITASLGESTE
jgi:cyclopropane fatty-acyl-phospholipid synthase-like methyltransferase